MSATAQDAREQLVRGFASGISCKFLPAPTAPAGAAVRDSAVLVLFGALDRVAAATGSRGPRCAVSPELDVLLTRRATGLRHHPGQIAFPGGGAEAGDPDLCYTALREAHEETGLNPAGVDVIGSLAAGHIPVSNYRVTPVLGWWRLPSEIAADHSESSEVFRVPVCELLDPAARGTTVASTGKLRYRAPAFRLGERFGGHLIWGFTALTLASIFDALDWASPYDKSRIFDLDT